MPLPINVSLGTVTGQFILPDGTPAQGTILLVPGVQYLPNPTAAPWPATILNQPVTGVLDVEGFLCRPDVTDPHLPGARGVVLAAGDDPDLSVQGWTWTARYAFTNATVTIPDHAFFLPTDAVLDLTTIVKVPSSPGVGTAQALALASSAEAAATASANYASDAAAAAGVVQGFIDSASSAATPSAVVVRDSNARAKFADPAAAADAATKGYTDTALNLKLDASQKGAASGVAPLDSGSRVPEANLPTNLAATALNATYGTPKLDKTEAAATYATPATVATAVAAQDIPGKVAAATAAASQRKNRVTNPIPATNSGGYGGYSASGATYTGARPVINGTAEYVLTWTSAGGGIGGPNYTNTTTIDPTKFHTAQLQVTTSINQRVTLNVEVRAGSTVTQTIVSNPVDLLANVPQVISVVVPPTAGTDNVRLQCYSVSAGAGGSTWPLNSTISITKLDVEEGITVLPFFYGGSAGGAWLGTAYASESVIASKLDLTAELPVRPKSWVPFALTNSAGPRCILSAQDRAAEYSATANKTYISWLGRTRSIYAVEYDHATRTLSPEVFVQDYGNLGLEDDHGVPSMCVTSDGKINIISGGHDASTPKTARSTTATVTGGFTSRSASNLIGTYHSLTAVGNTVYCLYRPGAASSHATTGVPSVMPAHEFGAIASSTDGMATWSASVGIIDCNTYSDNTISTEAAKDFYMGGMDTTPAGRLGISFTVAHGPIHGGSRSDVFYVEYNPADGHVYTIGGTDLGTAVNTRAKFDACLVSSFVKGNLPRQAIAPDGKVALVWAEQISTDIRTKMAWWNGSAWTVSDTAKSFKHMFEQPAVRWAGDGWEVFAPVGGATYATRYDTIGSNGDAIPYSSIGADFHILKTTGSGTFTKVGDIRSADIYGQGINGVSIPRNSAAALKALVVPGSISYGNAGGMPGQPLALYGVTDGEINAALVAANPKGAFESRINTFDVTGWITSLPAADSWQYVQLSTGGNSPNVSISTVEVLVAVSARGNGTSGKFEVMLKQGQTERAYDAVLTGRGEWGTDEVTEMFWLPVTVRAFHWKYTGNLGAVRLQLAGIRVQGPLLAS